MLSPKEKLYNHKEYTYFSFINVFFAIHASLINLCYFNSDTNLSLTYLLIIQIFDKWKHKLGLSSNRAYSCTDNSTWNHQTTSLNLQAYLIWYTRNRNVWSMKHISLWDILLQFVRVYTVCSMMSDFRQNSMRASCWWHLCRICRNRNKILSTAVES